MRWYSGANGFLLLDGGVNDVVHLLEVNEAHEEGLRTTNIMPVVERSGRNPHCSSGNSPFA